MVSTMVEGRRRCGYRVEGGYYLCRSEVDMNWHSCGKLPIPLGPCEECGYQWRAFRGIRWWHPYHAWCRANEGVYCIWCGQEEAGPNEPGLFDCPVSTVGKKDVGLLQWVGPTLYKTPGDFIQEACEMGLSRRISRPIPKFEPGKTTLWLAHRFGRLELDDSVKGGGRYGPAVFMVTRPTHMEYVVTGRESDEMLEGLENMGIRPVRVERA